MNAVSTLFRPLRTLRPRLRELKKHSLLVLLPLVCGLILLAVIWNITHNQMEEHGKLTTQYFRSEVVSMFEEAERACSYLRSDEFFMACIRADSPTEFDQFALCSNIRKYTAQSTCISDIYVCNSNQERIHSSRSDWKYTPYTSLIKSTALSDLLHDGVKDGWHVLNSDDAVPYYITRIPLGEGKDDVFIIVTLEMSPLLRFMHTIDAQGCALFNEEGFITPLITSRTDIDWTSDKSVSQLLGTNVECFYADGNNYTYMVAVAEKKFNTPLRLVLLLFGLYFVVITAVGIAYLAITVTRERKRFSAIINYLPSANSDNPSEEELLTNIKLALRQSQSDQKKYEDAQRSNSVRLILKHPQNPAVSGERYVTAGIPTDAQGYCVVSLFVDDYSDMFFDECDELQNLDFARIIFRIAFDEIAAERMLISGTGLGRIYASVFCFQGQEEPTKLVQSIVRETIDFIEQNYGLNLYAAVSGVVEDPYQICKAYQETEQLKEYMKVVGIESGIISTQNLTDTSDDAFDGSYISQLQILSNAIHAEKFDMVPAMVDTVLEQYISSLRRHYHVVQSRITTMTGLLSESVLACKIPDLDLVGLSRRFREAQSVAEVSVAAHEVFGTMHRYAEETFNADPVNRACEYIKAHSSNPDLSLPTISEQSGVTPQHLTRLFRKKLGCTVAEYLHSYRITCGKKLLAETDLSVAAIAQQVGYNSTNTFTYNFRHCEGITPANYREIALRHGEENSPV